MSTNSWVVEKTYPV